MPEPPLTPPEGRQREMTGNSHNPVSLPEGSPPLPTSRRPRKWSALLLVLGIVYLLAGSNEEYQYLVLQRRIIMVHLAHRTSTD
jgi:hypothetical protein